MARVPQYREDAKGNIASMKAECAQMFENVINGSDSFIMSVADFPSYVLDEYEPYLTDRELEQCFRKASGHKSLGNE
jgi:hypothetical protein